MVSAGKIIGIVVALILMGVLLPIGLNEVLVFTSTNSTIQTLVATVLPILVLVGIIMMVVPKGGSE